MKLTKIILILVSIAAGYAGASAQTNERFAYKQDYALELRAEAPARDENNVVPARKEANVISHIIKIEQAAWLRLHFIDYQLGSADFITITSLEDNGTQRLDRESIPQWRSNSAYFNGGAVRIELHVVDREADSYIRLSQITVGILQPDVSVAPETICGTTDDRISTTDSRVGRINNLNDGTNVSNPFCTAFAVSNGTFLTAGHCADFDADLVVDGRFINGVVEFNVPASQPNGTTVFSNPSDQYPINQVTWQYGGPQTPSGLDWAVFSVSPNSNTGDLPHPTRGFFRMTDQNPTANSENVRITGYGLDNTPVGTTGGENAQTRTLQTHAATYLGQTQASGGTFHSYAVDTTTVNSGSPVIWSSNPTFAIGIHTDGGCTPTGGSNQGTGFGHDPLKSGIQNFWGPNTIYVDPAAYPNLAPGQRNGTIFRPHSTLSNGVTATPVDGNLLLVPSTYSGVTTLNKAMVIRAPAGAVTIVP